MNQKNLILVFLFLIIQVPLFAQIIELSDGNSCYQNAGGNNFLTLTLASSGGSPSRNTYTATNPVGGAVITITWSSTNSRWEIQYSGGGVFIDYASTATTAPNPPALSTGTWTQVGGCGTLARLQGSGTTTALPVELISFDAFNLNNNVELNWTTASELNNEKFEVEYSSNGIDFLNVGEVIGNGTSREKHSYSFNHMPDATSNKVAFYRLKQMDFDGKFEYSEIVKVNLTAEFEKLSIYPNPSQGLVNLDLGVSESGFVDLAVYDLLGNLVKIDLISVETTKYDLSSLPDGIYMVEVKRDDKLFHSKLVIDKG